MAATPPPSYTPPPAQEPQRGVKDTFSDLMDDFVTWVTEKLPGDVAALAANAYTNALAAFSSASAAATSESNAATSASNAATSATNSADSATAAAVTAGATLWVSGQVVQRDAAVISPADRRTYRRKTVAGSGATDPSVDATNYVLLSADASSYMLLGTATVASPVAAINFLNLFSDVYRTYVIEAEGIACAIQRQLMMRLAVAGVVNTESVYYASSTASNLMATNSVQASGAAFTVEIRGARTNLIKSVRIKGVSRGAGSFSPLVGDFGFDKASAVSGFQIFLENGENFTAGTVRVYGVRA